MCFKFFWKQILICLVVSSDPFFGTNSKLWVFLLSSNSPRNANNSFALLSISCNSLQVFWLGLLCWFCCIFAVSTKLLLFVLLELVVLLVPTTVLTDKILIRISLKNLKNRVSNFLACKFCWYILSCLNKTGRVEQIDTGWICVVMWCVWCGFYVYIENCHDIL